MAYVWNFLKYLLIVVNFLYHVNCESTLEAILEATIPEEGKMNFTQLAAKHGSIAEQHSVETDDGCILTVFRLAGHGPPVLLWHGLGDTADEFIVTGHDSLALTLCREGYDVWLGNSRGNRYARRHVRLNPDTDMKFWDYSFDEIGYYDLAATIDHIRNKTTQDSVSIIGHSQGATIQYVLASLRPEYNSRIKVSIALSPGVITNHPAMPVSFFTSAGPVIDTLIPSRYQEFLGDGRKFSNIIKYICTRGQSGFNVCVNIFTLLAGPNAGGLELELFNVLMGHVPSSMSRKNVMHYFQVVLRERFCRYDYGSMKNLLEYGTAVPPDYDLGKVSMPTALFAGMTDKVVKLKDVAQLRKRLPNMIHYEVMKPKLWNHLDFIWGPKMTEYLYPPIISILKKSNFSSEPTSASVNSTDFKYLKNI